MKTTEIERGNSDLPNPPEAYRSERYIALATFILTFFYLCLFRRATWIDLDEGIILQGAQRVLDGQVLYRDFFSFFTPGSYYLLALVFRVFGDSYIVAHTLLAVVGASFSPITYLLSRRVCGTQASLLVTGLMAVTALPMRFVVLHNWDSTLWACLSLYCAVRLLETTRVRWGFASASFGSLTVLFEQSKGAGLLLGLLVGFAIIALTHQQPNIFTRSHMFAIALGLVWPVSITSAYFARQHALGDMLSSWFWPLQHYSTANRVPYGFDDLPETAREALFQTGSFAARAIAKLILSPRIWIPFLPLFGIALLLRLLFRGACLSPLQFTWRYYVLVSASISGLWLSVVMGRADHFHFTFLQPIFFLLLAWLLDGKDIRSLFFIRLAPVLGFCLAISLLAMAASLLVQGHSNTILCSRRGVLQVKDGDGVIDYLQAHTVPGERILIYPYQPTYYYLTQTYSPTRFEFCQPGMNTYDQLQEMRREFSARPTRLVLYEPAFPDHIRDAWPHTPTEALARDPMLDYIAHAYYACANVTSAAKWRFVVMARKDQPCP